MEKESKKTQISEEKKKKQRERNQMKIRNMKFPN